MSRRIGFVDHRLDNYHADVYLMLLRTDLSDLGFTVASATALETEPSQAWAADNDVPWFDDVATLDEPVDHYVVLAPSNPGSHLDLCRQVFPCGKSTYVDKTFAPDLSTAEAIFALADTRRRPADDLGPALHRDAAVRRRGRPPAREPHGRLGRRQLLR